MSIMLVDPDSMFDFGNLNSIGDNGNLWGEIKLTDFENSNPVEDIVIESRPSKRIKTNDNEVDDDKVMFVIEKLFGLVSRDGSKRLKKTNTIVMKRLMKLIYEFIFNHDIFKKEVVKNKTYLLTCDGRRFESSIIEGICVMYHQYQTDERLFIAKTFPFFNELLKNVTQHELDLYYERCLKAFHGNAIHSIKENKYPCGLGGKYPPFKKFIDSFHEHFKYDMESAARWDRRFTERDMYEVCCKALIDSPMHIEISEVVTFAHSLYEDYESSKSWKRKEKWSIYERSPLYITWLVYMNTQSFNPTPGDKVY